MLRTSGIVILFGVFSGLLAQNPIVPPGVYMADPTARVWDDSTLYIYGSVDESTDYYCSYRYHVLSTRNLRDWEIHRDRFSSRGENDQVPYSDALLFAPDCILKGDTFYLYYCQPDPLNAEGVAVSTSPTGPFRDGAAIDVGKHNQIDPGVFIDDDGQAYYVWGQFTMKMAKMNPDMRSLDPSSIMDSVITEKEHYFHEGPHLVKREGIYYLVYAHLNEAGMPTGIGYCMADSPMGPFRYGGVIVDNDHCDPGNWNNHGSIMKFRDQWYVFYHRSTHNSRMMRKACLEPIWFNEDGTIDQVEMTSQGAGPPLDPYTQIPAEWACLLHGNVRITAFSENNEQLTEIRNKDQVAFKYLDFSAGADSIVVRIRPGRSEGGIHFKADMPWGPNLGYIHVKAGEAETGKAGWQTLSVPVSEKVTGIKALWLQFYSKGEESFSIDWIQFK
jgi:hypothetical protein